MRELKRKKKPDNMQTDKVRFWLWGIDSGDGTDREDEYLVKSNRPNTFEILTKEQYEERYEAVSKVTKIAQLRKGA